MKGRFSYASVLPHSTYSHSFLECLKVYIVSLELTQMHLTYHTVANVPHSSWLIYEKRQKFLKFLKNRWIVEFRDNMKVFQVLLLILWSYIGTEVFALWQVSCLPFLFHTFSRNILGFYWDLQKFPLERQLSCQKAILQIKGYVSREFLVCKIKIDKFKKDTLQRPGSETLA